MRKIFLFFLLFIMLTSTVGFCQGYNIQLKINGLKDTSLYLGYYLGEKKYVIDTARINTQGITAFRGDKKLEEGIYLVILPNKTFFDIIITDIQEFAFETDTSYLVMDLKIKGSKQNQIFADYQKHIIFNKKRAYDLKKSLAVYKNNADSVKLINSKILLLKNESEKYNSEIIKNNPETFVSKCVLAATDILVPEPPKDKNGNITDSLFQYNFYKKHYFDNIDLTDDRMIRTPFLQTKIDNFFRKTVMQLPDSIIYEAELLLNKTMANQKMFRYTLSHLVNTYENSKYIGMEKVFVSLADKYYFSGKAIWIDSTFVLKLKDRVEKIRPNMMGNKAPELNQLETESGEWASLADVKSKYTIIVFWEPNCNHCQKAIPKLREINKKYKKTDLEVFAFYTQKDTVSWRKFIETHDLVNWINVYDKYGFSNFRNLYDIFTTPTFYILDENKIILARKIDVEAIDKFMEHFIYGDEQKK